MRAAKMLAGPFKGVGLAILPVGLIAFGSDGRAHVAFVDTDPLAMAWQGRVAQCRKAGTLTPDILDTWSDVAANGVTQDIELLTIPIKDGQSEEAAFGRAWDEVLTEWAGMSIEAASLVDEWVEQMVTAMKKEVSKAMLV